MADWILSIQFKDGSFPGRLYDQNKGYFNQFQELLFQQENGGDPIIPFDEIVNTTKASFAAIESLKEGKWISIK